MKHLKFSSVALLLCTGAAYGASAGAFSGSFADAFLIPTVVCSVGSVTLTGGGVTICAGAGSHLSADVFYGAVLASQMRMPNGASDKAILLMASLETGITTDTLVQSQGGNKSTSSASGAIVVTPDICLADGFTCGIAPIFPDHVTFQSQIQTLSATLAGLTCTANTTTGAITCTTPETIELLLSVGGAHSFNFLVDNSHLGAGTYTLHINLNVTANASISSVGNGALVQLAVGAGSLGNLVVQTQTPFNTIGLCPGNTSTAPATCTGSPF